MCFSSSASIIILRNLLYVSNSHFTNVRRSESILRYKYQDLFESYFYPTIKPCLFRQDENSLHTGSVDQEDGGSESCKKSWVGRVNRHPSGQNKVRIIG